MRCYDADYPVLPAGAYCRFHYLFFPIRDLAYCWPRETASHVPVAEAIRDIFDSGQMVREYSPWGTDCKAAFGPNYRQSARCCRTSPDCQGGIASCLFRSYLPFCSCFSLNRAKSRIHISCTASQQVVARAPTTSKLFSEVAILVKQLDLSGPQ